MDAFLGLITLALVLYYVIWNDFLKPLMGLDKPKPVKRLPPLPAYKQRSRRSTGTNAVNAGSAHSNQVQPVENVQPNVQSSAPIPSMPNALDISQNELQQLAAAIAERAKGATVEEALSNGFGVKKGGSSGYKRAKELFDLATKAP